MELGRVRIVCAREWTTDVAGRVRVLDTDCCCPCSRHHDEQTSNDQKDIENDEGFEVERFLGLSESPIVVEPHPAIGGHAHECTKKGTDKGCEVTKEWDG
jgi:hypothetical protein